MAFKWNMSFQFGFADGGGTVSLAAGHDDIWAPFGPTPLTPTTLIPLGSVTKPWTALRVMQLVEEGVVGLEDPAHLWIDPVLERLSPRPREPVSLERLWGRDALNVTVRNLLGMTSGFADYPDEELETLTLQNSGDDVEPFVYLASAAHQKGDANLTRGWVCRPGTCGSYSGANYVLLGLVLVHVDGGFGWADFDQRSVVPRWLWRAHRYPRTSFLKLGRCSQYSRIAHQFAQAPSEIVPDNSST
eukprot:4918922-Prymnesium_polylepis.1